MFRIQGKNFQSWESFDLEVDGLTVVIGSGNLGKSAICRAIMGIFRNDFNAGRIRNGSDLMTVDAVIDGHTIHAERKRKGSVSYSFDGEAYDKLDGDVPAPMKALGLGPLSIGDVKLDPIFARPVGSNFLLEKSPAELNAILGAFSSTGKLEAGKREAASRIAAKNAEAKLLSIELRSAEERRMKLQALEARAADILEILDEVEPKAKHEEALIAAYTAAIEHRTNLETIQAALQAITIPDIEPVTDAYALFNAARNAAEAKERYDRTKSILDRFHVPDPAQAVKAYAVMVEAGEAASASVRLAAARKTIDALTDTVAAWKSFVAQWKLGRAYEEAADALESMRSGAIAKKLGDSIKQMEVTIAAAKTELAKCQALDAAIDSKLKLDEYQTKIAAADKKLSKEQAALEELEAAARYAESLTVCPSCGETVSLLGNNLCQQPIHKHAIFN